MSAPSLWSQKAKVIIGVMAESGDKFTCEDLRKMLVLAGPPPSPTSVSAVVTNMIRSRKLKKIGFRRPTSSTTHKAVMPIWQGV